MRKMTLVMVTFAMLLCVNCQRSKRDKVGTVLARISLEWFDDGAGGCCPELVHKPEVKALLQRPKIWQELIDYLDSTATTKCTFERRLIPLGFVCLDILLKSVHDDYRDVVFIDSADDGLWATVREMYYFPPDILRNPVGKRKMASVRAAWESLYEKTNGRIWDISKHPLMR